MPFQDRDDAEDAVAPRVATLPERWLRKVFFEEWGLKLLALAITAVLWLAVTGQNRPVTLRVNGVQLNYLRPEGFELSNEPPSTVDVTFMGGAWSEPTLLAYAYDFEQATHARIPPTFIPTIGDALFPGVPNPAAAQVQRKQAAPQRHHDRVVRMR